VFKTNENFGHYTVKSAIGAGGMGEIYLAADARLRRDVAIKILPESLMQNDLAIERFMREAHAASALNHPNILTIYEIGEHNGVHFIAAEFVEGETLRQKMRNRALPVAEALAVAVQTVEALCAAHRAGIVHRDIKPENIMIRHDGYVKVLDFGLAKLSENGFASIDAEAETRMQVNTIDGTILGTVAYMSPEQARGQKVDARSDIFSFGTVLYEMLAGFNPFMSETMADILAAVLHRAPEPLAAAPEELNRIVGRALRKNRDERYQTCAALLADLKRFQQQLTHSVAATTANFTASLISQSTNATNSLAILPLSCEGGDAAQSEYLSDGITESIINALAQVRDLQVAPRNTVFRFKGREAEAQSIGKQLNVRTILTGRVRQFGENLIVGVELIDVENDKQIWGEQYRRPLADIFELQAEIAENISEKLRLQLTGEERKRLAKRYTEDAEAYQCYLKGRYFVMTKRTEEWIKKGIEYFQKAIELDPTYALAYSGLADAYGFLASSTGGWSPRDAYPKAKAAAERALQIDDTLGEAHAALGFFHLLYDWDFPAAEREFKKAVEFSPNYPNAHDGYGFYLKAMGRHAEAIKACQKMQRLDPLSPFAHVSLGWAYYFARRYDEAVTECRNALEIDGASTFAHRILGFAYLQQGKFDEALAALKKAVQLSSGGLAFEAHLGYAYALAGKKKEARQVLSELEKIARERYVSAYYFAVIHLGLGERERAFDCLEKAFAERSGFLPFLNVEPMLDAIRTDSRFQDLLRRVGLETDENPHSDSVLSEVRTAIFSPVTADAKEIPDTKNNEPTPSKKSIQNWLLIALLCVSIIVAGFVAYRYYFAPSKQIESIAVLPFENRSNNSDVEYLSDGMTETLISSLSRLPNLNVKARSSVFRYKDKGIALSKIGQELNVQAVLTGRVVQRGQDLTLYLELVDATTENVLWKENYSKSIVNLVSLQNEIARDVSQKLKTKLSGADEQKVIKNYTENTEAYQLYLKGRYHALKTIRPENQKAISYFQQAIEIDPSYALAYAGLADAYRGLAIAGEMSPAEFLPKAKAAAQKAIEIDDALAQAHAVLGFITFWYDWDWNAADNQFKRALELDPNNADAHIFYANLLSNTGRHAEALAVAERARELDPLNLRINALEAQFMIHAGRTDEALARLQKTLELDPDYWLAHIFTVSAYIEKGMYAEAIVAARSARDVYDSTRTIAFLGFALAKSGKGREARAELERLTKLSAERWVSPYNVALIYNGLGEGEETLRWLERGIEQRDPRMTFLKVEPKWNNLRDDTRFQEMLRRVGFPQ
jgi:eukaryotic-like serine/threonine-protein kinase